MTAIDLFRVQADPATGEWISEPERIGQIDRAEHDGRADTDAVHYDTFEVAGAICAIEVEWTTA